VLELLWLLVTTVLAWVRPRQDLVFENLLPRHQLAVLTRPTRTRPRARPHLWDKLLWVLARRWCAGWRAHLGPEIQELTATMSRGTPLGH
jgi:hypothetical protein